MPTDSPARRWSLRRVVTTGWSIVVAMMLVLLASRLEWTQIGASVAALPLSAVVAALVWAALNHAICSGFDLVGFRYARVAVKPLRTMLTGFVAHVGNLNFGPLVGAIGLRHRLYSRIGIRNSVIAVVTGLSMLTNWLGFSLVGGVVLLSEGNHVLPNGLVANDLAIRLIGGFLTLAVMAWFLFCVRANGKPLLIRRWTIPMPAPGVALTQAVLASLNWLTAAAIVHALLRGGVDYHLVLVAVMLAALGTMVTNVPSGLGVVEASFLWMLHAQVPQIELLAALLVYRAVYFLLPLLFAGAGWFWLERRLTHETRSQSAQCALVADPAAVPISSRTRS